MNKRNGTSVFEALTSNKILSVVLAIVLVLSMIDVVAFASDEVEATSTQRSLAETNERLDVAVNEAAIRFDCENSFAVIKGQVLATDEVKANLHSDFKFQISPEAGYTIDPTDPEAVTAQHALTKAEIPLTYNSSEEEYTVAGKYVDSYLVVTAKAAQIPTEQTPVDNGATPFVDEPAAEETTTPDPTDPTEGVTDAEGDQAKASQATTPLGLSVGTQGVNEEKTVYWNPSLKPIKSPADDTIYGAPGKDTNSGNDENYPLLTWEGVMKVIGDKQGWTVVLMTTAVVGLEETVDGVSERVVPEALNIDGGGANPTIVAWKSSPEELFEIPLDDDNSNPLTLTLKNVTLDANVNAKEGTRNNAVRIAGADYFNQRAVHGAQLVIDENVTIRGDIQTDLNKLGHSIDPATTDTKATIYNPIKVVAAPNAGTTYSVMYSGIDENLNYLEVDVIDTSAVSPALDAKDYFTLSDINSSIGWSLKWHLEGKVGQGYTEDDVDKTKLELYRDYDYRAIYLNGQTGSDANFGGTCAYPVKTFARAKQLLLDKLGGNGVIYVCDTVDITSDEDWSLPTDQFANARVVGCPDNEYTHVGGQTRQVTSTMIALKGGNLTVSDMKLDFGYATATDAAIVRINNASSNLTLNAGALLTSEWGGNRSASGIIANVDGVSQTNITLNGNATITNLSTGIKITGPSASAKDKAKVTLNGGTISNMNKGAINATNATVESNGATITGNRTDLEYGGGFYLNNSSLTMTAGTVSNNSTNYSTDSRTGGGGIAALGASIVNISGGTFDRNVATHNSYSVRGNGGAILAKGTSYVTISGDTTFTNNSAWRTGGAIYTAENATLTLNDTPVFRDNAQTEVMHYTDYGGGAIAHASTRALTIRGGIFENNTAGGQGGVFKIESASTVNISGGTFANNSAKQNAGVIYNPQAYLTISGGTFTNNTANSSGGVVHQGGKGSLYIGNNSQESPVIMSNNMASGAGAVYTGISTTVIGYTQMHNNTSKNNNGGGAIFSTANLSLYGNVSLVENEAIYTNNSTSIGYGCGGAIFSRGGTLAISDSVVIRDNSATQYGGAIYKTAGNMYARDNVVIEGNQALRGGAIYSSSSGRTCIDGTGVAFTDNVATQFMEQTIADQTYPITYGTHIYAQSCLELAGGTFTTTSTEAKDKDGAVYLNVTTGGDAYAPYIDATMTNFNTNRIYLHTGLSKLNALKDPNIAAGSIPVNVNAEVFDIGSIVVQPISNNYTILTGRTYYADGSFGENGTDVSSRAPVFDGGQLPEKTGLGGFNKNVIIVGEGIYLDGINGSDTENGGTGPSDAVKTWAKARELLVQRIAEAKARPDDYSPATRRTFEPYIYICGEVPITQDETWYLYDPENPADAVLDQPRLDAKSPKPTPEVRRFASYYGKLISVSNGANWSLEHTRINGVSAAMAPSSTSAVTSAAGGVDPSIYVSGGKATLGNGADVQNAYQYAIQATGTGSVVDMVGTSVVQLNRGHGIHVGAESTVTLSDTALVSAVAGQNPVLAGRAAIAVDGRSATLNLTDKSVVDAGTGYGVYAKSSQSNVNISMSDESKVTGVGTSNYVPMYLDGSYVNFVMTGKTRVENLTTNVGSYTYVMSIFGNAHATVGQGSTEGNAPVIYTKANFGIRLSGNSRSGYFKAYGYTSLETSSTRGNNMVEVSGGTQFELFENARITSLSGRSSTSAGINLAGDSNGYSYKAPLVNIKDNAFIENFDFGIHHEDYRTPMVNVTDSATIRNCNVGIYAGTEYSGSSYPADLKVNFYDNASIQNCGTGIFFNMRQAGSAYGNHQVTFQGNSKVTNCSTGYYDLATGSKLYMKGDSQITNIYGDGVYVSNHINRWGQTRDGGFVELSGNGSINNCGGSGVYVTDPSSYPLEYAVTVKDNGAIKENGRYGVYGGLKTTVNLEAAGTLAGNGKNLGDDTLGIGVYSVYDIKLDVAAKATDEIYLAKSSPYVITLTNTTQLDASDESLKGKFAIGYAKAYVGEKVVVPDTKTVTDATDFFDAFYAKNKPLDKGELKDIYEASPNIVVDGGRDVYIAGPASYGSAAPGNDANTGESVASPVATFERALEVLATKKSGARIIICNYTITTTDAIENIEWAFDGVQDGEAGYFTNNRGETWKPMITRDPGFTGSLINFGITDGTLRNLTFDPTLVEYDGVSSYEQFTDNGNSTGTVTMENVTFQNFKTRVLLRPVAATYNLKDITVTGSTFTPDENQGGFLTSASKAVLTADNVVLDGNTITSNSYYNNRKNMGLISVSYSSNSTFTNSHFTNTTVNATRDYSGMVIAHGTGTVTFESSTFDNNTFNLSSVDVAPFLASGGGTINLTGSTISGNTSAMRYSAATGMLATHGSSAKINATDTIIENNTTTQSAYSPRYAGFIYVESGHITLDGAKVRNNNITSYAQTEYGPIVSVYADEYGGANFTMKGDSAITNNTVTMTNSGRSYDPVRIYGGAIGSTTGGYTKSINLEGGTIGQNIFKHANPGYYGCLTVYGAGLYDASSGETMMTGTNFVGNIAPYTDGSYSSQGGAVYVAGNAQATITGGQFNGNQASYGSAVYAAGNANLTFAGGSFGGNVTNYQYAYGQNHYEYSAVYVASPNVALRGGRSVIDEHIFLSQKSYPLKLSGSIYQKNRLYKVDVASSFRKGDAVVVPDNKVITNATSYYRYFEVGTSGYVLAKQYPNLVLKAYGFLDSTNTYASPNGTTPEKAFVSLEQAKEFYKGDVSHMLFFVSGPMIMNGNTTWSLDETRVNGELTSDIIRYAGFSVTGKRFPAYAGDLVTVEDGATFNIDNVNLMGKRDIDTFAGGTLINVKAGGTANINAGATLTDNTSEINAATAAVNGSQGRGGAIYTEGTVNIKQAGATIVANNALQGGAIYLGRGGHLSLDQSPYISGSIYLSGTAHSAATSPNDSTYISAEETYVPPTNSFGEAQGLTVDIQNAYKGRAVVDYADPYVPGKTQKDYYQLSDAIRALYKFNNRSADKTVLELQQNSIVYVDGVNGNDALDGSSPARAVHTLYRAYELLEEMNDEVATGDEQVIDALIYVVNTVSVADGADIKAYNEINTNSSQYRDADAANRDISVNRPVAILRYVQPDAYTPTDPDLVEWAKPTHTQPLFDVKTAGKLTFEGLTLDGHSYGKGGDKRFAAAGVTVDAALVRVSGGTFADDGGAYLNNTNAAEAGKGGAFDIQSGTANIGTTTIRNTSAALGSAVYQGGSMVLTTGKTYITGDIYLAGSGSEADPASSRYIESTRWGIQNNGTSGVYNVTIADAYRTRQVVKFPDDGVVQAGDRGKFVLDEATSILYSLGNRHTAQNILELQARTGVYIDGVNGDDANSGLTAEASVRTLAQAYRVANTREASVMYVVDTVTIDSPQTIASTYFVPSEYDGTTNLNDVPGAIQLKASSLDIRRYVQPDNYAAVEGGGFDVESNLNALFDVANSDFMVGAVSIDGHKNALVGPAIAHAMTVSEGVVAHEPLIKVTGSSAAAWLGEGAILHDNKNGESAGGAIANYGSVYIDEARFVANEADQGNGIYQHGVLNIDAISQDCLADHEIYLAAEGEGDSATNYKINVRSVLPDDLELMVNVDNPVRLRDIAQFTDSALAEGVAIADEKPHFALGATVPATVQMGVSPTEFNTLELQGDVEIKYQAMTFDRNGANRSDDFTGGTVSTDLDQVFMTDTAAAPNASAAASTYYVFAGWYSDEACTQPVNNAWFDAADTAKRSIKPQMKDGAFGKYFEDATYFAKFVEETVQTDNMIDLNYTVKTVTVDGADSSSTHTGGTIDNATDAVSVITGKTTDNKDPQSAATANKYYQFIGWYSSDAFKDGALDETKLIESGSTLRPMMDAWADTEYFAVFQEVTDDATDMITLTYTAKTVDRDGNDRSADYTGGSVDPTQQSVSIITGTSLDGVVAGSRATAEQYYTLLGWYAADAFAGGALDGDKLISAESAFAPTITELVDTEYIAVFQEEIDDESNMIRIDYLAKTVDKDGNDYTTSYAGGTTDPGYTTISVITGSPTPSTAAANTYYHFVGWFDNYDASGAPAYTGAAVTTDVALIPAKPAGGWTDATYYAVFQENVFDENVDPTDPTNETIVIDYKVRTIGHQGEDLSATFTGGTISNDQDKVSIITSTGLNGSEAQANDYFDFIGWQDSTGKRVTTAEMFTPERPASGWVDAEYTAVFQMQADSTATIEYTVKTIDRDGNDRSDDFTGGAVDPAGDTISKITNKNLDGNEPEAQVQANTYYRFVGWYSNDAFENGTLDDLKQLESGDVFKPSKPAGGWVDVEYYAVFQEEFADKNNMVELMYSATTVDKYGVDRSADYSGGSVDPEQQWVSIITGRTVADEAAGSTATTEQYYTLLGWYPEDAIASGTLDTSKRLSTYAAFAPTQSPWERTGYIAVFQEEVADENNMIKIDYRARTVDKDGKDHSADYAGGTVAPASSVFSIITGAPVASTATANEYYHFVGWYSSYDADATPAYNDQVEASESFAPSKPAGGWAPATYYAVFQENVDENNTDPVDPDNKTIEIEYKVRTLDRDGADVSDIFTGGSVSPDRNKVSIITATGLVGSEATAAQYYNFIGWQDADGNTVEANASFTPARPASGWVPTTYYAVFQEDANSLATLKYTVRTIDRNGVDRSADYVGGAVDPTQDKVSYVTGKTAEGNDPQSAATAAQYYRFVGWYPSDAFEVGVLNEAKLLEAGAEFKPTMSTWADTEYFAVFQEEFTAGNEDNMVTLDYLAKTVDRNGKDRSADYTGGAVDPGQQKVSVITGLTVEGAVAGSNATTNTYYTLLGWYRADAVAGGTLNTSAFISAGAGFVTPAMTPWANSEFVAVFQEEFTAGNEGNMIKIDYRARTIDAEGNDISDTAPGGTVSNVRDHVSVITGKTPAGADPASAAVPAENHKHVGWYDGLQLTPSRVTYNKMTTSALEIRPTRPSNGWQDAVYEALFHAVEADIPPVEPENPVDPVDPTPVDPGEPEGPILPIEPIVDPDVMPDPGAQQPANPVVSAAAAAMAAPVEAVMAAFDGLREAFVGENEVALAGADRKPVCWIHYYVILGIILTSAYGIAVLVRRRRWITSVDRQDDQILQGAFKQQESGSVAAQPEAQSATQPATD